MKSERSKAIVKSGYLFIATNFLLAVLNIVIGLISGSLAITSDAIHSLIDSVSGFLIIISEKIARSHKFEVHRAKIERITTVVIALIIIVAGVDIIVESVEKLIDPEPVEYSVWTFVILAFSIVIKYWLARYLKTTGKNVKSDVLIASGAETLNDTWISVAVLTSVIIYTIFKVDVEAYISLIIAVIIIKVGLEFIFPHISRHHHHPLEADPDHDHCGKK